LIPYLEKLSFQSRKKVDFELWTIAIRLLKHGYHLIPEGKDLLVKISLNTNKVRYSTSKSSAIIIEPNLLFNQWRNLLKIPSIFDPSLSYQNQAREYSINKRKIGNVNKVYIYHHDVYIGEFSNYSSAQKFIGLKSSSRMIYRYIDTNKKNKLGYSFYSNKKI
jgi:hypothetical protein